MEFERLFPEVPEDLATLDDEQLQALLDEFRAVSRQLRAGEIDLSAAFGSEVSTEDRDAEAMRQWQEAATSVQSFRDEQTRRVEADAEFDRTAAELDAQFGDGGDGGDASEGGDGGDGGDASDASDSEDGDEDDDEADGDDAVSPEAAADADALAADPDADQAAEPVVAAAAPVVRFPAVGRRHEARETGGENPVVLVAAAGNTTARVRPGAALSRLEYAQAAQDVNKSRGPVKPVKGGGRERILIASAESRYPTERTLITGDHEGNLEKLRAAGMPFAGRDEPEVFALLAAGVCPPPTPVYSLPDLESTARPVKEYLTTFNADRGGVSLPGVDTIGDVDPDAISVITNDDANEGGTFATKSCADITCTEWVNTFVDTIAHCRGVDNLMGRTWPEGIAKQNSLTLAALARTADGKLLDGIDALSLETSGTAVYGASSTLLYRLQMSRLQMISELRLPTTQRVDVLLPFWGAEMFSLDLVNGNQPGRFDTPQGAVEALLSKFGFNVYWHLDQGIDPSADQEIWSAQGDGDVQVDWPGTQIIARVSLPGTFIRLDTGTLELGVVRDSDLNAVNKYQLFGELWENVARVGPLKAAHRIAITICPTGVVAPTDGTAFTCAAS